MTPPGLPDRLWLVIRSTGECDFLRKEPLEGMAEWAKGLEVTIAEYRFRAVVHTPPLKKAGTP